MGKKEQPDSFSIGCYAPAFHIWYSVFHINMRSEPHKNSFCNTWTTENSMERSFVKSLQVALWTPSSLQHNFFRSFSHCIFFALTVDFFPFVFVHFLVSSDKMAVYGFLPLCEVFICNSLTESWRLFFTLMFIRLQIRYEKGNKLWTMLNLKILIKY